MNAGADVDMPASDAGLMQRHFIMLYFVFIHFKPPAPALRWRHARDSVASRPGTYFYFFHVV